jgi:hypothetical protein
LRLVERLADEWGTFVARSGRPGKSVWFALRKVG